MFGIVQIIEASGLFAAAAATCVGFAAIWSNPKRRINRLFFSASLHVCLWLIIRFLSTAEQDLNLYRATTAIGALMHFHLWLIKETVVNASEPFLRQLKRGGQWLFGGVILAVICSTEWFIPTPVVSGVPHKYGFGFFVYVAGLFFLFCALCLETARQIRGLSGVQRLELQLLLVGGSSTSIVVLVLMVVRSLSGIEWMSQLVPYAVLAFYAATVVGITTSRVFDARQLLLLFIHRSLLLLLVVLSALSLGMLLEPLLARQIAAVIIIIFSLWLAGVVRRRLDKLLQYYPRDGSARQAALWAAQRERHVETLEAAFRNILRGWGQAECATICSYHKRDIAFPDSVENKNMHLVAAMRQLKWVTPERLARERHVPERQTVSEFLSERELGGLVLEEGLTLSVLVGVGVPASRRPFTYPQISDLLELASIMGSALERVHFSTKVQHAEQLATVGLLGASLAHEIRNPLVSIKTFVQLLPGHYQEISFRNKFFKLISDEVGRIEQLTDQLLDLASPRSYTAQTMELNATIRATLDLVAAKAYHRNIAILTDLVADPGEAFTDPSAARQVVLNLCFNAIQAVEGHEGAEKWIKISTRRVEGGIEMAIADSGPGIPPEMRTKLFQPFQTTKSTGFGLGLAICSDILENLNASISVDPYEVGRGAIFRVIFPCRPS